MRWCTEHVAAMSVPRSEAILRAGAAGDDVVLVLSGRVRLVAYGADQREVMLAIRGPGELLGEMAALGAQRRTASAIAVDDVEAGFMHAEEFRALSPRPSGRRTCPDPDACAPAGRGRPRPGCAGHAGQRRASGQATARPVGRARSAVRRRDTDRAIDYSGRARAVDGRHPRDGLPSTAADAPARLGLDHNRAITVLDAAALRERSGG